MIEALLTGVALVGGSLFMGYVTRSFWLLLLPVLGSACLTAMAAGIQGSGDGGAEWAQAVLFLTAVGLLVLGVPSMLIGIVWGRTKAQVMPKGQSR